MTKSKFIVRPLILSIAQGTLLLSALPLAAQAQQVPGAGQLLQQVPQRPATPPPTRPGVTIQQPAQAPAASSAPFLVQRIEITGNTVFDAATLRPLVADGEGKTITLAQLDAIANRITEYYRTRGYPLTRAIIPAQTLTGGTVRLQVLETRYGKINLENSSKVSNATLSSTLSPLQSGQLLSQASLDRALLLLSDYPGVSANATLSPGAEVGTTDLNVRTVPSASSIGSVYVDSAGSRYTGRMRAGANVDINNPLGRGDAISLSGLTSAFGLDYARAAYQIPVTGQGTRLGIAASALQYKLGGPLKAVGANGRASTASIWGLHPLIRSVDTNLYVRLGYEHKEFRDRVTQTSFESSRSTDSATIDLSADRRDGLLGGGIMTANVGLTAGRLKFDNAAAEAADAATANTHGDYTKINANISRLQALTAADGLFVSFGAQWSNDNLDSSEQMVLGGPGSVRGYGVGSVSGGSGYLATAELRHRFSLPASSGVWQAVAFIDSGYVKVNANQWAVGPNTARLSGAGVGVNWIGSEGWSAKVDLAGPFGSTPVLVGERNSGWAWVQIARSF